MTISERLKGLMKERKITQKEMSERLDISPTTFNSWMHKTDYFPAQYVAPICEILNISPYVLLTGEDVVPVGCMAVSEQERFLIESLRALTREGYVSMPDKVPGLEAEAENSAEEIDSE